MVLDEGLQLVLLVRKIVVLVAVELIAKVPKYVSRAGLKLEAALDHFRISLAGKTALDCGISTGGFTDCMLRRGASRVCHLCSKC